MRRANGYGPRRRGRCDTTGRRCIKKKTSATTSMFASTAAEKSAGATKLFYQRVHNKQWDDVYRMLLRDRDARRLDLRAPVARDCNHCCGTIKEKRSLAADAVMHDQLQVTEELLRRPNVSVSDVCAWKGGEVGQRNLLHVVMMKAPKDLAAVRRLIRAASASDVNKRDSRGHAPLVLAARAGYADGIDLLVEDGRVDRAASVPLALYVCAVNSGRLARIAEKLVALPGADVNAMVDGQPLLSHAMEFARDDGAVVRILLDAPGIDLRKRDMYGRTPSDWARGACVSGGVRDLLSRALNACH